MNREIAVQIFKLALSLLRSQSSGAVKSDVAIADMLFSIVRIAAQAYRAQFGRPIDPSLIKAEPQVSSV
jgi:hypothetical protein